MNTTTEKPETVSRKGDTRGLKDFIAEHVELGSTAERVIRYATRPVLVVRKKQ